MNPFDTTTNRIGGCGDTFCVWSSFEARCDRRGASPQNGGGLEWSGGVVDLNNA